jgi:hypothetical protein
MNSQGWTGDLNRTRTGQKNEGCGVKEFEYKAWLEAKLARWGLRPVAISPIGSKVFTY